MKINVKPPLADLISKRYGFGRPANAIPFHGSKSLFTVPGCDGVLFKAVTSWEELEALGSGVAYFSANGEGMYAFVGKAAAASITIDKFPAVGADLSWRIYGPSYSRDRPCSPMQVTSALAYARLNRSHLYGLAIPQDWEFTIAADATPAVLADAAAAAAWFTSKPGSTWGWDSAGTIRQYAALEVHRINSVDSFICPHNDGVAVPYPVICGVVAQATAGFLYRTTSAATYGWMSTLIPYSNMAAALKGAADAIYSDAPGDIKKYVYPAYDDMRASGQLNASLNLGIVTYFGHPQVRRSATCEVGVATYQGYLGNKSYNGAVQGEYIRQVYFGHATAEIPYMPAALKITQVPDLPGPIVDKVAGFHRLAAAAKVDGTIQPLGLGGTGGGSWADYMHPVRSLEYMRLALAKTVSDGEPTDPILKASFNPTLAKEEDLSWYYDLVMPTSDLICGNFRPRIFAGVKSLYQRIEQRIKA